MEKIIRVTGKGKISVKPDMICLDITARGTYPDYEEAIRKSADHTKLLRRTIEKSGLPGQDLKTKDFSVQSEYESYRDYNDNYKKRFLGYSFYHRTEISFPNDNKQLGRILYELARCPGDLEFSINHTVKDREKVKNALLKKAVEDSREKAEILTGAAGVELGQILRMDYSWGEINIMSSPIDSFEMKAMPLRESSYDIDIEADDIDVSDTVTIEWEIK